MQFHYRLILNQGPTKIYTICNGYNLTVFDELSNDTNITENLNYHQSISRKYIHKKISILNFFLFI
jgi:hypothetical protein